VARARSVQRRHVVRVSPAIRYAAACLSNGFVRCRSCGIISLRVAALFQAQGRYIHAQSPQNKPRRATTGCRRVRCRTGGRAERVQTPETPIQPAAPQARIAIQAYSRRSAPWWCRENDRGEATRRP